MNGHHTSSPHSDQQSQAINLHPVLDIGVSSLELAHMSLFEAFRIAQPPLSEALRLLFRHLFRARAPVEEIKTRLDRESRQSFVEVRLANAVCALSQFD